MAKNDYVDRLITNLVSTVDVRVLTLVEIDRLHRNIGRVVAGGDVPFNSEPLARLADELDDARRFRRLVATGHVRGQVDFDGLEVPY